LMGDLRLAKFETDLSFSCEEILLSLRSETYCCKGVADLAQ